MEVILCLMAKNSVFRSEVVEPELERLQEVSFLWGNRNPHTLHMELQTMLNIPSQSSISSPLKPYFILCPTA